MSVLTASRVPGTVCNASVGGNRSSTPYAARSQRSRVQLSRVQATAAPEAPEIEKSIQDYQRPDIAGRFGKFGGKYVPETLIPALAELEVAYKEAIADPAFQVMGFIMQTQLGSARA